MVSLRCINETFRKQDRCTKNKQTNKTLQCIQIKLKTGRRFLMPQCALKARFFVLYILSR
jgi:hypothetical protein